MCSLPLVPRARTVMPLPLELLLELEVLLELLLELELLELLELELELELELLELELELEPLKEDISNRSSRISLCPVSPSTTNSTPLWEPVRLKHTDFSCGVVPLKLALPTLLPPTETRTVAELMLSEAPRTVIE